MSNIARFTTMFVVMVIFLELVGIPTVASSVLGTFGISINDGEIENADIANSEIYSWIFGAAGILAVIAGGGAVIIGLFAKSYDTSLVILPLIISIGGALASTAWTVILYASSQNAPWLTKIVAIVFVGLGIGFLWSCVDYFRSGI